MIAICPGFWHLYHMACDSMVAQPAGSCQAVLTTFSVQQLAGPCLAGLKTSLVQAVTTRQ